MADESLADVVLGLAEDDPDLPDQCKYLIVAALESDEALASVLEADDAGASPTKPDTSEVALELVGAYLSSIEVAGFRGIGPRTTLELHPGPGLTIVAGRNGSGKSSFAEALELALTGTSYRWENRPAQWMNVWRNQSQPDPCAIRIGLAEEDNGTTTLGVDWAPDAELTGTNPRARTDQRRHRQARRRVETRAETRDGRESTPERVARSAAAQRRRARSGCPHPAA